MPDAMSAGAYIHRIVERWRFPPFDWPDTGGRYYRHAGSAERADRDGGVVTSDKDMFQLLTLRVAIYDVR